MRRLAIVVLLCLGCALSGVAQSSSDSPATKEDVERYFQVMHSHEMMQQMMQAMSKPMHQMIHQQFVKDRDRLPPDFEARMNKTMDDMLRDMPFDQMMQAMVPAYQKHFTKGDIDGLIAFYSSSTGQKVLRELPSITAEAMQSMMPIMSKQMDRMKERLQQDIAQSLKAGSSASTGTRN